MLSRLRAVLPEISALFLAGACYVFIASAGHFADWPKHGARTATLADAFLHGQISLLALPPPELVAAPDPLAAELAPVWYWDAAYYQGKYYFYWGPVPALLLSGVHLVAGIDLLSDARMVFLFALARLLVGTIVIRKLFSRLGETNAAVRFAAVLTFGLLVPYPTLLSRPYIYEVAVVSAQFFLIVALLCELECERASGRRASVLSLTGGTALALAIGCRVTALAAVAVILATVRILEPPERRKRTALIALPIVVACAALGYYNYARFGSPFEVGTRYQLTFFPAQTGLRYAAFNIYQYLFRPVHLQPQFPFLKLEFFSGLPDGPWFLQTPKPYFPHEPLPGLLYAAPFMVWLPLIFMGGRALLTNRTLWYGVALCSPFLPCLFFFASTNRYIGDGSTGLLLLALVGYCKAIERSGPRLRTWLKCVMVLSCLSTCAVGFLLAFDFPQNLLQLYNPELLTELRNTLSFGS